MLCGLFAFQSDETIGNSFHKVMGIYYDRGLQYEARLENGETVVIAPVKSVDERLKNSSWLSSLGGLKQYLDPRWTMAPRNVPFEGVDADEFDIELTAEEQKKLDSLASVESHGWRDVVAVWDTYGGWWGS